MGSLAMIESSLQRALLNDPYHRALTKAVELLDDAPSEVRYDINTPLQQVIDHLLVERAKLVCDLHDRFHRHEEFPGIPLDGDGRAKLGASRDAA